MPLEDPTLPMCLLRIYLLFSILKGFIEKKGVVLGHSFFFSAMLLVHLCGLGGQRLSPLILLSVFIIWRT